LSQFLFFKFPASSPTHPSAPSPKIGCVFSEARGTEDCSHIATVSKNYFALIPLSPDSILQGTHVDILTVLKTFLFIFECPMFIQI
jgi:hypothetical protein